jgi:hypothetical protein
VSMDRQGILESGKVVLHAKAAGMVQRHEFSVEREETAYGKVPFLVCVRALPLTELVRLAEENQLPVKCAGQKVYPKGKGPRDFAGL